MSGSGTPTTSTSGTSVRRKKSKAETYKQEDLRILRRMYLEMRGQMLPGAYRRYRRIYLGDLRRIRGLSPRDWVRYRPGDAATAPLVERDMPPESKWPHK